MRVNSSMDLYSYKTQPQDEHTQKSALQHLDKARETLVGVAKNHSTQAKIDAYVAGSKEADTHYHNLENTQEQIQNYNDFAADVRKSENYNTYLNNDGKVSELSNRDDQASIQPIENPYELSDEQRDTLRQGITAIAGYKSLKEQIDAYKAGSENANSAHQEIRDYVTNYNKFADQVRRSEYINTYIENSKIFA